MTNTDTIQSLFEPSAYQLAESLHDYSRGGLNLQGMRTILAWALKAFPEFRPVVIRDVMKDLFDRRVIVSKQTLAAELLHILRHAPKGN